MSGFSWQGRPCLVTGGSGFGGSHLCLRLLDLGARVIVLDRWLPQSSHLVRSGKVAQLDMIHGDIRDRGLVVQCLSRFEVDTVFHLAAQPIVPISNAHPAETLSVNVDGTYSLLEALRSGAARRLVFASSGAYYGSTTQDAPLDEEAPPLPASNIYAPSKVAADVAVRAYARVYGLATACCRFMNTYGPGDDNFTRIVPRAAKNLVEGRPYDFGDRDDGSSRLDFLHIRDMAEAYVKLAEHVDEVRGEAFNFGSGVAVSTRELALRASRAFDGREREPIFSGKPNPRPTVKYLDTRKAERMLGWRPSLDLDAGLTDAMAFYRQVLGSER